MATRLQLTVLLIITLLNSVCNSQTTTTYPYTLLPEPPLQAQTTATATSQPPPPPPSQEPISTHTILAHILTNLGFQELALAVPSITDSTTNSSLVTWNGPVTLFAPTDDSIRSCASCSVPRLLKEHIVPGIFSLQYLTKLAFGTKLETMNPSRCITITSSPTAQNSTKIFIDGVEIVHPDLFNDGLVVIHGLQGFVSPLSPSSCNPASSPSPLQLTNVRSNPPPFFTSPALIMRVMLRDAMVRLHDGGYSVLSLAFRIKYAELATLQNMTVFALDDASIFSGGHGYVTNIRFHIVPDRLLMHADLMTLPAGTLLPTLVHGESLVVTNSGASLRINYVPIKSPDEVYNSRVAVHGIFLPFPHLRYPGPLDLPATTTAAVVGNGIFDSPPTKLVASDDGTVDGSCDVSGFEDCAMAPSVGFNSVELHDGL